MEENNMTVKTETLREWLEEKENVIVVDVRPQDQRNEWYIPGSKYLDAYKKLREGDLTVLNGLEIPDKTKVVVTCAAGKTSLIATEELRKRGIEAYSLEGGMKGWSLAWNTAEFAMGDLTIVQVRRTGKGCLSYIIASRGDAIVIDASIDADVYKEIADKRNWKLKYVLDTHIHADHLSRTPVLAQLTGAELYMPENNALEFNYKKMRDGDVLEFGTSSLKAIHTPGHTLDSTSYILDDKYLFTGDTLFAEGVGRPDLKADEAQTKARASLLYNSLQKLLKLEGEMLIFPGHTSKPIPFDDQTIYGTLEKISAAVPSLHLNREEFVSNILNKIPPTPPNYLEVSKLNIKGNIQGIDPSELEAGANRCAIS